MDDAQLRAWLRYIHLRGIPLPVKLELLGVSGSSRGATLRGPQEVLCLSDQELRQWLPDAVSVNALRSPTDIDADMRWLDSPGNILITLNDDRYPLQLREIPDPPLGLYVAGDIAALEGPTLAVVGARRPTPGGITVTRKLVGGLGRAGLSIVSGLALGIDGQAHVSALECGARTIAVMATGPEQIYPARHSRLAGEIVAGRGAILSEFPVGTAPKKEHFPKRNRIISGISLGVLVIEAARRSGSLITARLAAEQNREVFAVPGSILSPVARGCNDLIYSGAAMARSVEDVLAELAPGLRPFLSPVAETVQEKNKRDENGPESLLKLVGFEPIAADQLIQTSGLTAGQVSSMLLRLEIDGWLARCADGTIVRVR